MRRLSVTLSVLHRPLRATCKISWVNSVSRRERTSTTGFSGHMHEPPIPFPSTSVTQAIPPLSPVYQKYVLDMFYTFYHFKDLGSRSSPPRLQTRTVKATDPAWHRVDSEGKQSDLDQASLHSVHASKTIPALPRPATKPKTARNAENPPHRGEDRKNRRLTARCTHRRLTSSTRRFPTDDGSMWRFRFWCPLKEMLARYP